LERVLADLVFASDYRVDISVSGKLRTLVDSVVVVVLVGGVEQAERTKQTRRRMTGRGSCWSVFILYGE
jgi:hypothetical protein